MATDDVLNQELFRIYQALDGRMRRPKGQAKPNKYFICDYDVRHVWSHPQQIRRVFARSRLDDAQENYIRQRMLLLLSCLIYIRPTVQTLDCFLELCNLNLNDDHLPLKSEQVRLKDVYMKDKIIELQYAFIPYVIKLTSDADILKVPDEKLRMPFERIERRVGAGHYGQVYKVVIAAEHLHEGADLVHRKAHVVACKKMKMAEAFKGEVGNIRILRQSITSHAHIMTHLGAIDHGRTHYILFPYADFGDLRQFLDQESDGEPDYKHADELPGPANAGSDIAVSLILQLNRVCDALKWLHNQVRLTDGGGKVVCVHMDLRPDNILIKGSDTNSRFYNKNSDVGKWLISDFGISVMKDDPEYRYDVDYLSIGEWIDRHETSKPTTVMETPRRGDGTHQAPEIESYHNHAQMNGSSSSGGAMNRGSEGIGRRSDVWSFACIAAEVLAFQVGRQSEVKAFVERRRQHGNAHFYEPARTSSLQPPGPGKEFQVRASVIDWLDEKARSPSDQLWMECFVGYIKKTLIVDPEKRPTTEKLAAYMNHVHKHVSRSKQGEQYPCKLLQLGTERRRNPEAGPSNQKSPAPGGYPTLDELTKFYTAPLNPLGRTPPVTPAPQVNSSHHQSASRPSISVTAPNSGADSPRSSIVRIESDQSQKPGHKQAHPQRPSHSQHPSGSGSLYSLTLSDHDSSKSRNSMPIYAAPENLNGILIKPDINRKVGQTKIETIPGFGGKKEKTRLFVANSVSNEDYLLTVAYIVSDQIHFFKADTENLDHRLVLQVQIPSGLQVLKLAISGDYIAVLGKRHHQNAVFACERTSPQLSDLSSIPTRSVRVCSKAVVSRLGFVAAVCDNVIYVVRIFDLKTVGTLTTETGASFADVAFNESGNRLLAWAFGRVKDVLHVWRCDGKMPIEEAKEAMTIYEAIKESASTTQVMPYSSYQGAIIKASGQRYSAAQIRGSLLSMDSPVKINWVIIENTKIAQIYQDHSLLTLEQPLFSGCRLMERRIDYPGNDSILEPALARRTSINTTHVLYKTGELIHKFESKAKENTCIQVLRAGNEIFLILYNDDGKVEWARLVPC